MTPDSGIAVGTRPTVQAPAPELAGWAGAATAVHAIQQMPMPMTLRLHVADHGVAHIDFAYNAFEWEHPLDAFPVTPASVLVETCTAEPDAPAFELPGRTLDPLLWSIGFHAFGDEPAPWLVEGHRYHLRRWPSLSGIEIDLDQVRMIAMLGNAFATADELAAAAHTPPSDARRLVNALSVAGMLRRSTAAPALDAAPASAHSVAPSTGLFARLRERWGH
ncbi:MAG: hypothetical protein ABI566_02595 [Pseudolysinimonas sp.]